MYPFFKYILYSALPLPVLCSAEECCAGTRAIMPDSAFVRGGFSATNMHNDIREFRVGAGWDLSLPEGCSGEWVVLPGIEMSAGYFEGNNDGAFIGGVGPSLIFGYKGFPLFLEASVCATYISRHEFGPLNIGVNFQFTSGAGITWKITDRFSIGYRFQHMSNASLSENNPGVNLHIIAGTVRF